MLQYKIDSIQFGEKLKRAASLMNAGADSEVLLLFNELYASLRMNGYKQRRKTNSFRKAFFGLTPDIVLATFYNMAVFYMNTGDANRALFFFQYYRQIEKDFNLTFERDFEMAMSEAESMSRLGKIDQAINIYSRQYKNEKDPARKVDILIRKGTLEVQKNHNKFAIEKELCQALGDAEAVGDGTLISMCYFELARMIGLEYPALGVSLLWKARIWNENVGEKEMLGMIKTRMALALFFAWHRYGKDVFRTGTLELIAEVDREVFRHDAGKATFDRIKGIICEDLNLIRTSLSYFETIRAYGEVCSTAEAYIKTANALQDADAAKNGASRYEKAAIQLKDQRRLNHIRSIDIMKLTWALPKEKKAVLNLLDVLDHIAVIEEDFQLQNIKNPIFPTHYQEGMFTTIRKKDGKVYLYPCELFPFRYYRGQVDKLEGKKCQPSLYRGLSDAKVFRERLCMLELENLIGSHPLTHVFKYELTYNTPEGPKPMPLSIDCTALGQHYGIKTADLDLTADKWVAAFFAATDYVDGQYKVHMGDGEGVFYFYDPNPMWDEESDRLGAVGLQPFSRPARQAGVVYKMEPEEDFNKIASARIVFKHDPAINELIFNFCNRSKKLFPEEILEEKVKEIHESTVYSNWALSETINTYYSDTAPETIAGYIKEEGISFQSMYPVTFSQQELIDFNSRWLKDKEHFFDSIYVKLAYEGPVPKYETEEGSQQGK